MRKIIAAINMTLDGFCDHTAIEPDEEIHKHYADLLNDSEVVLYGRITYQLMEFWRALAEEPSGEKSMDDFASVMDRTPKIVFSKTIETLDWNSAELATHELEDEVLRLRQRPGKDILVGSRSLIIQLLKLNLIDEFQLCIHPVIAGQGLLLFEDLSQRIALRLIKTKTFKRGAVILYYEPADFNKA